jgi:hypothetical protein
VSPSDFGLWGASSDVHDADAHDVGRFPKLYPGPVPPGQSCRVNMQMILQNSPAEPCVADTPLGLRNFTHP